MTEPEQALKRTPLHDLHLELGAKLVPFAGYEMPVQYPAGVLAEHLHTREKAGLFDASHMGQVHLFPRKREGGDPALGMETLVPGDIRDLAPLHIRYTMFTNPAGGIMDDLMVANVGSHLSVVVNASCKQADIAHMKQSLGCLVVELEDRALLALQGPQAAQVMARLAPESASMRFMTAKALTVAGIPCFATRSGYTGEDGFEISVAGDKATDFARALLAEPEVAPIGLGARDSLRLEAGLCLYGSDIDTTTSPIEASLAWTIAKRRRAEGGFPGAEVVQAQLAQGVARRRVGILPEGKAPARAHTIIQDQAGNPIGEITSGGFGPSFGGPVAMGYVATAHAAIDTPVQLIVRGVARPAKVVSLPFVPHRYAKG